LGGIVINLYYTEKVLHSSFNEIATLKFFIHSLKSQNHPVKHSNSASRGKPTNSHNFNSLGFHPEAQKTALSFYFMAESTVP